MTYISNLVLTSVLEDLNLYKISTRKHFIISHLRVLGSIIYVFIHNKERKKKSAKWKPRKKHSILVEYDSYTIY